MGDLTEKQRRFVEAYMGAADGNATEAADLAGYKGTRNALGQQGHENLQKPKIRQAIRDRVATDPLVADREEVTRYLTDTMRGNTDDDEDSPIKRKERTKAAKLLAEFYAMLTKQVEVSGQNGDPIALEIQQMDDEHIDQALDALSDGGDDESGD